MNTSPLLYTIILASETIVKASLLVVLAAVIASLFRKKLPAASHLVWVLAFVSILALPFVSLVAPATNIIPVNRSYFSGYEATTQSMPSAKPAPFVNPGKSPLPKQTEGSSLEAGSRLVRTLRIPVWLEASICLWLVGFLAITFRSGLGLFGLRIIRKYGTQCIESEDLIENLDRLGTSSRVNRTWDLRTSLTNELRVPMTWGIIRPTVLLPKDAEEWPISQFEAVMLHELAHVRRFDYLTQFLAEIVCAIYWFNPIVWLGARAMRSDAELAADEAVLRAGLKPSEYASALMKLAANIGSRKQPFAYVGTLAMKNSKIENRLKSVLKFPAGKRGVSSLQMLTACALALVILPVVAGVHVGPQQLKLGGAPAMTMQQDTAKSRLKMAALATVMYAQDWDGDFPYAQSSASAAAVMTPYVKNVNMFQSPTKGGQFVFNMNLAGVNAANIPAPADIPMWAEVLPSPAQMMFVAYADGHVKWTDLDAYKKASLIKFKRASKMKPLPVDWMVKVHKSARLEGPTPNSRFAVVTPSSGHR